MRAGRLLTLLLLLQRRGRMTAAELAAVLGCLQPLRVRRAVPPDEHGWVEATFGYESVDGAVVEVLSLGGQVEVLGPAVLRREVTDRLQQALSFYVDRP